MARLLLVRHAQSTWNAEGRWQGQADPSLSDLGARQARAAVERLGHVDAIVSSDLRRASQTAEIIAGAIGLTVRLEPLLRERHVGEWSGLTRQELEERWPGFIERRVRPPGWEDDESLLARSLDAVVRLVEASGDDAVLVVTHGGNVGVVERHLGAARAPLANLAGRWVDADSGRLVLGERVLLVDPEDAPVTVPRQP